MHIPDGPRMFFSLDFSTATLDEAVVGHDLSVELGRFLGRAHPVRILKVDVVHPEPLSAKI